MPFAWNTKYERDKDLGDKLVDIGGRPNWESFRPTLESMYRKEFLQAPDFSVLQNSNLLEGHDLLSGKL